MPKVEDNINDILFWLQNYTKNPKQCLVITKEHLKLCPPIILTTDFQLMMELETFKSLNL